MSTGSGGSSVPRIQVFRPTMEEFKNFSKYIQTIESMGAHKAGLAKIIPPEEWIPRKNGYDDVDLIIPAPISQVVNGRQGLYQQFNIQKRAMTVKEFQKLAEGAKYRTPSHFDYEDLERKYWRNIAFNSPIYGADVSGSLYDDGVEEFNIQHLNTILDLVKDDYEIQIEGVNTAYLYFGMWKTTFAWHTEDMDLYSINYLHFGAPKSWYAIPPEHGRRLERLAANFFNGSSSTCSAFLRHKMTIISPQILRQYSIPYNKITQEPGEFMITFPFGYHSGFNHGFNCAESTNFAMPRWIEYGKRAISCSCRNDCVKICMDMFVRKFQPDRYELWKVGKDIGAHPEDPTKQYAAPPPKKVDLALAAQRERKKAKLLETSQKSKRLPISKLGKHHEKYKIESASVEIRDDDSGSEATEIYDMSTTENEVTEHNSPHPESIENDAALLKQTEKTSDNVEKEVHVESHKDDSAIILSDSEEHMIEDNRQPVHSTQLNFPVAHSSRQLPSLKPYWDLKKLQNKAPIDDDLFSRFPTLRDAIQSGALALTRVPSAPSLAVSVPSSNQTSSSHITISASQPSLDCTLSSTVQGARQSPMSSLPLVKKHLQNSSHDLQLKPKVNMKKMYVSTTELSPSSSNWKCQQTQGLKVRLAKESQRKRARSETSSSSSSSSESSREDAGYMSIQALAPFEPQPSTSPLYILPTTSTDEENIAQKEINGKAAVQDSEQSADKRSHEKSEGKNRKEHKKKKASSRNVRAADDRLGNWAQPILRLWQHYPFNFEEEQKFNVHCSSIEPHCAVCVIFSPCNITNGYPNPPIRVPANSKVKMPTFCFGNGIDDQVILDSNPLMSRDGTSPLLVCSSCKVCVHAACYGVTMLQMGCWTCARCSSTDMYKIECCLCVMRGGALKPTNDGRWAHITCAILIPETYVDDVVLKEPINVSQLTSNRQRLKCRYCFKSLHTQSTNKGACVQCLSGKCYLPFHVTCGYMAGVIYDVSDWPEPLNISCTAHSGARRKPRKRVFTEIKIEDKVLAKHKRNKRYYWVQVRQIYMQEYYSILFEDNSTSTNTLPEDIVDRETKQEGCPNINEKVKVKWTDGIIYNAIFKGSRSCKIYVIEFDDGTLITQERDQIYASDENIPKEILSKVGTATESQVGNLYKTMGEGKRVRISNTKYKFFES